MDEQEDGRTRRPLWWGAALTTIAVGLFPRLNAVIAEDVPIWELDPEARVLFPAILVLSVVLFATIGTRAWRPDPAANKPAKFGLICGVLSIVGAVAFFLSLPIMLGGLAATLGIEGRKRATSTSQSRQATTAVILGIIGFVMGAAIWVLAGDI